MKIKSRQARFEELAARPVPKHKKPMKQLFLFRLLLRIVSIPDLLATKFKAKKIGMERLGRREPCLILMNHSSFIDLKIASRMLFPRRFSVVCTTDGFVGKNLLMRFLGCIPTKKFVLDLNLIRDMQYALKELKSSVLLYPEAGYSLDGRATVLPETLGGLIKRLGVPVVMLHAHGAFARQPLYNNLIRRRVKTSAEMTYLLSPEEIAEKSAEEINAILAERFSFDYFAWQRDNRVVIDHPRRAECLHRILYKCPHCLTEGKTEGKGETLTCHACGKAWRMDEYGALAALDGDTRFSHIPDWCDWEREEVRREIDSGTYRLDCEVEIGVLADTKCLYRVGNGRLIHSAEGFSLTGCDAALAYQQSALSSYTLNSDFYWYELGDVIGIGNQKLLYYCFPKDPTVSVAKARFATEELHRRTKKPGRKRP